MLLLLVFQGGGGKLAHQLVVAGNQACYILVEAFAEIHNMGRLHAAPAGAHMVAASITGRHCVVGSLYLVAHMGVYCLTSFQKDTVADHTAARWTWAVSGSVVDRGNFSHQGIVGDPDTAVLSVYHTYSFHAFQS